MPWGIVSGIGVFARAIGLAGTYTRGMREPMAYEIKRRAEEEATAHLRRAVRGEAPLTVPCPPSPRRAARHHAPRGEQQGVHPEDSRKAERGAQPANMPDPPRAEVIHR